MVRYLLLTFLLIKTVSLFGGHIVGGEMRMKPSGINTYEISLIQYWEKNNLVIPTATTGGNRDPDAQLFIYSKATNTLMDRVKVIYRSSSDIEYKNVACATIRSLNTVIGVYTGNIYLDPLRYTEPNGYYIVWERCCRNGDINNILDPAGAGMVFYLEFPPLRTKNTSPEFRLPNGEYICNKKGFTMNMSAFDADGDELRYSLVTPMNGYTTTNKTNGDDSNKSSYPLIKWANGISISNVIPGASPLAVDNNGVVKVISQFTGLYVFTIQCDEYRNGIKIGVVRRDFQLLVIDCNDEVPEPPVVTYNTQPATEVKFCPEKSFQLETKSAQDWSYQWQFNGLNIPGATDSRITVKDTGNYTVIKSFKKKCSRDTSSSIIHAVYAELPEAKINVEKSILCTDETTRLIANNTNGIANLTYLWKFNNDPIGSNDSEINIKNPGLYSLTVTEPVLGCSAQDTASVRMETITVTLPERISLVKGRKMTITPEVSPPDPGYVYNWSPTEGIISNPAVAEIEIAPLNAITYKIEVVSENGCKASAVIIVNVIDKIHIPAAFSPNNDGLNDVFEIFNANGQIEDLKIFNRWGTVIYSSKGYEVPWDGTVSSSLVPAGSYPYIITSMGETIRGEVLILR